MCEDCGCASPSHTHHDHKVVDVNQSLLAANDALAEKNREHIEELGAVAINLISSPGSGKTTLLEKTIERLGRELRIGVIEGDIETERDAERIRAKGVPVVQLTTGGACHLDAALVHRGIHELEDQLAEKKLDLLFIENVGNLVCPATFYLGEHQRVVMISVPEGPDKPAKYPKAFIGSHVFMISKTDLLPYFDFPPEAAIKDALQLNPQLTVMTVSATTGEGFDSWLAYLRSLCR
ncbi:MAG: hydrogenase accessory protein HypB [Desulfurivibrio sp.]|nr:MAG: hydrogenase accessory protein HypB [Desulfurivibrio sp.]